MCPAHVAKSHFTDIAVSGRFPYSYAYRATQTAMKKPPAMQGYDDIGADAVAEMQRYLDEWKKKYGRTSYLLTTKHAIRIPWEEMK